MTNNIIAFDNTNNLPFYIAQAQVSNDDLAGYTSQGFPSISIKGKVFTVVSGGERKVIPNPLDPQSPATRISVILVKVNPDKSKTYYAGGYKDGATGEEAKPTCFSNNGHTPDAQSAEPQCQTCAACKWNVFGTSRGADGSLGKGKACSDFVRVVLCTPDNPEELYLLRVPPASIRALGELSKTLNARKVPYQAVVTEISFDMQEATPRLVFTPKGFVGDAATFNKVIEQSKSEMVRRMILGNEEAPVVVHTKRATTMAEEAENIVQEFEQKNSPVATVKASPTTADSLINNAMGGAPSSATPAPTAKPAAPTSPAKVVDTDDGLAKALDDLGFD